MRPAVVARLAALAALGGLLAAPAEAATELVAYLPGAPVESAARLGAALDELGAYLDQRVPGLGLAVRPFRRSGDALAHLGQSPEAVAMLLVDSAFLLDLPPEMRVVPTHRVQRSGSETGRKLVVVPQGMTGVESLADLKGRSISVAQSAGQGGAAYLALVVFGGEVAPSDWFGEVREEADELTATANVLYGQTDAALVSEDNPLLEARLQGELRTIFSSEPLSLPVLAVRESALSPEQSQALDRALLALGGDAAAASIREGLRIDGFGRVADGGGRYDRQALLTLPERTRRSLEIAAPSPAALGLVPLPPQGPAEVSFQLGLVAPELELSAEDLGASASGGRDE